MRYAGYYRCSTDDQAQGDFTTIDAQRQIVRAYVNGRGGTLVAEHSDEGKTGTNLRRPGWQALLRAAKAGAFDVVACTYISRLGRGDAGVVAEYLLRETGVTLELVQESFGTDMAGRVHKQVTRLVDSLYVEQVRDWTISKMRQMAQTGQFTGGHPPFGYAVVDGRLVPSEEADAVRAAFDLFLQTQSVTRVQDLLRSLSDRRWALTTVRYLLRNERYTGISYFRDVSGQHPPIVDQETFEEVQALLTGRTNTRAPRQVNSYCYHLRGLVWCPHCGSNYTQSYARSKGRQVPYYVCNSHNHGDTKCPVVRVNADKLHTSVITAIEHAATHWTVMRRVISESPHWSRPPEELLRAKGAIGKRLQFIEARQVNLTNALADGRATEAIYGALERIEAQRTELRQEQEKLAAMVASATVSRPTPRQVMDAWGRLLEVWHAATDQHRTELMQSLVDKVTMQEKRLAVADVLTTASPGFALSRELGAGACYTSMHQ